MHTFIECLEVLPNLLLTYWRIRPSTVVLRIVEHVINY